MNEQEIKIVEFIESHKDSFYENEDYIYLACGKNQWRNPDGERHEMESMQYPNLHKCVGMVEGIVQGIPYSIKRQIKEKDHLQELIRKLDTTGEFGQEEKITYTEEIAEEIGAMMYNDMHEKLKELKKFEKKKLKKAGKMK